MEDMAASAEIIRKLLAGSAGRGPRIARRMLLSDFSPSLLLTGAPDSEELGTCRNPSIRRI